MKIKNASILITGGCGFIGSNLAVALAEEGARVTCLDNLSRRGSEILLTRVREHGCDFMYGDIRNPEDFDKLKDEYDALIECSAEPSVLVGTAGDDARFMINNNLVGSINCFEFARVQGAAVLFLSTSRVYPYTEINGCSFKKTATRYEYNDHKPGIGVNGVSVDFPLAGRRSLYGATKLASELILQEYAHQYDMRAVINRCGVIAGPWQLGKVDQGVFTYWLANHYFNKPLRYIGFGGKGLQVRDLMHIDDLIDLVKKQLVLMEDFRGEVFNAGGSTYANLSLLETTALCRELTGRNFEIGSVMETRPADVIWYLTDNGETEKLFNWRPQRNPETILADILSWMEKQESLLEPLFGGTT